MASVTFRVLAYYESTFSLQYSTGAGKGIVSPVAHAHTLLMSCCKSKYRIDRVEDHVLTVGVGRLSMSSGSSEFELMIKMVIVGDSGVGKSAMLIKLVDGSYTEGLGSTIGVDFKTYKLDVNERPFKVIMWDTAGQERFEAVTSSYYRGMHAVLLVYDTTNHESYNRMSYWLQKARINGSDFDIIIVGCKSDLISDRHPAVDTTNLTEMVGEHRHVIISSKTETGFKQLKECLAHTALNVLRKKMEESRRPKDNA